jgi:hypothetical protein
MRYRSLWKLCLVLGLACVTLGGPLPATGPRQNPEQGIDPARLRPRWEVGDQWIVQTASLQSQAATVEEARTRTTPIRWKFSVEAVEPVDRHDCYRVAIRSLVAGRAQPATTIWVDCQSAALRRLRTQLPVAGGFRTVIESYGFPGGEPSPVLGPIPALPIDMPIFVPGHAKSLETFGYECAIGPPGAKDPQDLRFGFEVEQRVSRPASDVKRLLPELFAKDAAGPPLVEVRLKRFDRQVRQLWQPGQPWPTYTDNGVTVGRLVRVIPASPQPTDRPEVQR